MVSLKEKLKVEIEDWQETPGFYIVLLHKYFRNGDAAMAMYEHKKISNR